MRLFGKEKHTTTENRFKAPVKEPKEKKARKPLFRFNPMAILKSVLDGSMLSSEKMLRNYPFLLFIALLILLHIANAYYSEKNQRKVERTAEELKELRYEYINNKSKLMYLTNHSEISKRIQSKGIKESVDPPVKLFIKTENKRNSE
ncbi:MAG: FtsL-like putative cell division protein [Bacteroidales bacterium]|nr:FtsL-like putative cell division protein [Bacteroidales bacterium]